MLFDKGIIVSIQKYSAPTSKEMIEESINAGAIAIRTDKDLEIDKFPIIGLKKIDVGNTKRQAYITPTIKEIEEVSEWTNIIAIDFRRLNPNLEEINQYCIENNLNIIADIACMEDFRNIMENRYRVAYVTTALSVLYKTGKDFYFPDKIFIRELLNAGCKNLIAEGKFQTRQDVKEVYNMGCKNICIGDAIANIYKKVKFFTTLRPGYNNYV